jgi:hypothetical protein
VVADVVAPTAAPIRKRDSLRLGLASRRRPARQRRRVRIVRELAASGRGVVRLLRASFACRRPAPRACPRGGSGWQLPNNVPNGRPRVTQHPLTLVGDRGRTIGRRQPDGVRGVGRRAELVGRHVGRGRRVTRGPGRRHCGRIPTSLAAACALAARARSFPIRASPRANARSPSIASRGRLSLGACVSNRGSVRSATSAAHTASTRRSSSLSVNVPGWRAIPAILAAANPSPARRSR